MKAIEAPEKIYLPNNPVVISAAYSRKTAYNDVEYIRTDAFIDKVCFWLELNLSDRPKEDIKFWLEDFKNYMEGE